MVRKTLLGLLAVGLLAAPILAQQPNLSGTWKLNSSKSDFGPFPGPDSETRVIDQQGSTFKETIASQGQMGAQNSTVSVQTDGKEVVVPADSPMAQMGMLKLQKISAAWTGSALVVAEALKFGDEAADVSAKNSYTLSPDGKVLTITSHLNTPMGDADRKILYDKQDGASAPVSATPVATAPIASSAAAGTMGGRFSGSWKLNLAKSDFGQRPAPASRTDIIDDNGSMVKIASHVTGGPRGDQDTSTTLTTDGKENTVSTFGGREGKATAIRDANTLVVTTKATFQDNQIVIKDTWTLEADGKTLKIASHINSPMGEFDRVMSFDKQ